MATAKRKKTNPKKGDKSGTTRKNTLRVPESPSVSQEHMIAEIALSPITTNINTAKVFAHGMFGELDLTESVGIMRRKTKAIQNNDLSGVEETLIAQATALDMIFNELARRAAANMGEYMNAAEIYLKLALKAQTQCRTTLQTLNEIKNPRHVTFAKQTNIAHGHQQVNNGQSQGKPINRNNTQRNNSRSSTHAHAGNSANQANELLETNNGNPLDTRTTGATSQANQVLETVGTVNRAKD